MLGFLQRFKLNLCKIRKNYQNFKPWNNLNFGLEMNKKEEEKNFCKDANQA